MFLLLFLFLGTFVKAQDPAKEEPMFKFKYYGYVSYEAYLDTYNSVITRDGELYLYPKKPKYDSQGNDLNKNLQLNMLSLQSRVGSKIQGPDAFGAKTSALIEADFFGTAEEYKNLLRIRHAYMSLKWEKTTLLMGMYWHPLFTPECFPSVIGFGAAVPYNPLNRSPQIRVDFQATDNLKIVAVASEHSQGYHHSVGPEFSQRSAEIPDIQLQTHLKIANTLLGFGAGYFQQQPLVGNPNKPTDKKVHNLNAHLFFNTKLEHFTLKGKAILGQNLTPFVMLGGFGRIIDDITNDTTFRFTSIETYSSWIDFGYNLNPNLNLGLFVGISGNLGANKKIKAQNNAYFYERNADIYQMYRIGPRVSYTVNKLQFAFEYFFDQAQYATKFNEYYRPKSDETQNGTNHRVLFSAKYFFE